MNLRNTIRKIIREVVETDHLVYALRNARRATLHDDLEDAKKNLRSLEYELENKNRRSFEIEYISQIENVLKLLDEEIREKSFSTIKNELIQRYSEIEKEYERLQKKFREADQKR